MAEIEARLERGEVCAFETPASALRVSVLQYPVQRVASVLHSAVLRVSVLRYSVLHALSPGTNGGILRYQGFSSTGSYQTTPTQHTHPTPSRPLTWKGRWSERLRREPGSLPPSARALPLFLFPSLAR
eukprot:1551988-Rhodomonas_salina.1